MYFYIHIFHYLLISFYRKLNFSMRIAKFRSATLYLDIFSKSALGTITGFNIRMDCKPLRYALKKWCPNSIKEN